MTLFLIVQRKYFELASQAGCKAIYSVPDLST
jgi:hypothetical protein